MNIKSSVKPVVAAQVATPSSTKPKPVIVRYELQTVKHLPSFDIGDATLLIYGERKIGKSGIAAQFPGSYFFAFEKGFGGLEAYVDLMIDKKGNTNSAEAWEKFKKAVDVFVTSEHQFRKPVIDTIDVCFQACTAWCGEEYGFKHPGDLGYGKGWAAVETEFVEVVSRLVNKFGLIAISHAVEREIKDNTGGTYDKIIPTMANQAKKYISAVADAIIYFGYYGNDRLMTIRGSSAVESGTRLGNTNFFISGGKEKYNKLVDELIELKSTDQLTYQLEQEYKAKVEACRVHSIPAGIDARDAYSNFIRAFNNEQPYSGKPGEDVTAVLSDVRAPFKKKK